MSTWDGDGGNANWSTAGNWNNAPVVGATLTFPPVTQGLNNTNDLAFSDFQRLVISVSGYTFGGNVVSFDLGILATNAAGNNTLNFAETDFAGDATITVQNPGATLTINGEVEFENGDLTVDGEGDLVVNEGLDAGAAAGLIKNGPGSMTLLGENVLTGASTLNGGALIIDGILFRDSVDPVLMTVNDGALLQGEGETDLDVNVNGGGEIRPGNSPGSLGVGAVNFAASSILSIEINGPTLGVDYSSLLTLGNVTLNNSLLRIALGAGIAPGGSFTIIQNGGGAVSGQFNDLEEGETFTLDGFDNIGFNITYQGGDGNDVVINSLPVLSISDATVQAPSSGTATATFTVTLSEASDETVTVEFQTQDGTAIAPLDYTASSGTLTFDPGETVQTVNVTVNANSGDEDNDEIFFVALLDPSNAAAAVDEGTGTITAGGGDGGGCALQSGTQVRAAAWMGLGMLLSALTALRITPRFFRRS